MSLVQYLVDFGKSVFITSYEAHHHNQSTLLTPSFGNCVLAFHLVLKHLQQNVNLMILFYPKSLKSATKILKIDTQINIFGLKGFFHCKNVIKRSHYFPEIIFLKNSNFSF